MNIRVALLCGLLLLCLGSLGPAAAAPPAGVQSDAPKIMDLKIPALGFLPDSFVICRVGSRITRVSDYIRSYFDSYIEDRPKSDSAGRVTFLDNIVAKDVLGQVALAINRPLRFEDRATMREFEVRALSNALYRTSVMDSLQVTDQDVAREYETFKSECRLRHILFADQATAIRTRLALQRGQTLWQQAYDRYSLSKGKDKGPDGDLGWAVRGGSTLELGRKVFLLNAGSISEPIEEAGGGWNLVQVVEKRAGTPPSIDAVSSFIRSQLEAERTGARARVVRDLVRDQIGMVYDSTNIAWASKFFQPTQRVERDENGQPNIVFNTTLPDFEDRDSSRVLARYKDGVFTLGRFMHLMLDIQPLIRPNVDTPESFRDQLDAFAFEPYMAQVAVARGLDRDSTVVSQIAKKREEILVEHLYSDSVLARVNVDPRARRKYYEDHVKDFVTYASVRFAALWAESRPAADSLAARLRRGERAEDIIRADSLLGIQRGSVQTRAQNEHGPYQKVLFEELRPGQLTVDGPDKLGHFAVVQKIEDVPGRQLSYEEASGYIDESMQNQVSERLLKELVARHKKKFKIESHPELVMRIRLVDPTL